VMKTLKTLMIFINQYKHIQILLGVKIKGSLESTSFFTKEIRSLLVISSNRYK
jgi:hypothetical protein